MLALWAFLAGCGPKGPPPVAFATPDEVTEERLDALVAELVPLVEQVAGRRFTEVPRCRLGRRVDLERILSEEYRGVIAHMIDAPDWVIDVMSDDARAGAGGVIGKYGVYTRVLYLAPETVFPIADSAGLPPDRAVDVARLILAHELAHALQDQAGGGEAVWRDVRDMEAFDALRMLTEGHANFVERGVAARLGLTELAAKLDEGQGWTEAGGPMGAGSFELWALYGQGLAWVRHLDAADPEAVWTLLAQPPPTTTPAFRFGASGPDRLDAGVLDGIERELTEEPWIVSTRAVGDLPLREALYGLDAGAVDAAIGHLTGSVGREAMRSDRQAVLWRLRFDGPDAAAAWVDLWQPGDGREVTPLEAGDRAVVVVSGPPPPRSAAAEETAVWIARGSEVVAIRALGFRPGRRLDAAVRRLLDQWGQPP